jgi:hypothetical protein
MLTYFCLRCSRYGVPGLSVKKPGKKTRNRISRRCACLYQVRFFNCPFRIFWHIMLSYKVVVSLKHNVITICNEVTMHNHPPEMFGGKVRLKPRHMAEDDRETLRMLVAASASNESIRAKARELFKTRLQMQHVTVCWL